MTTAGSDQEQDWSRAPWRRAGVCRESGCVEVASIGELVGVRDSKAPDRGVLVFTRSEWDVFRAGMARGDFDSV